MIPYIVIIHGQRKNIPLKKVSRKDIIDNFKDFDNFCKNLNCKCFYKKIVLQSDIHTNHFFYFHYLQLIILFLRYFSNNYKL